ncbi:MAG TPA: heat-inducible transcriptional repressor HrcA [Bryobacteraceae bacterium]
MTHREQDILHSIVESYIQTGEPVGSQTVSRHRKDNLSAASIRNVMADLCDGGYLSQPHTSAGRIPTEKAFRSYVHSLARARLLMAELQRLRSELSQMSTMEARVERSSQMLTEMTQSVGITAAIPASSQTLDQIELIGLADHRVLMIVVTRDRVVHNRVVALDELVAQDDLLSIRNYINRNFSGWSLSEIHSDLKRRFEEQSAAYDAMLNKLTLLYSKGLLDIQLTPEIHMEGTGNLVGLDLHLTREKLRELFHTLEEKKRILQLLDRFLEQPAGELAVQVGLADAHPSLSELSLIGVSIPLAGGVYAKIAVLGPMRMNYGKAMSAVYHVGQAFRSLPV